jgi:PucR C-terminal helix-turn-helix domain/GGDEF-like domain
MSYRSSSVPVELLLGAPGLAELSPLTAPGRPRPASSVSLVESTNALGRAVEGAFVVVGRAALGEPTGYLLDTAVRLAGERGVAALVLPLTQPAVPETTSGIAERAGLTLLAVAPGTDLGRLCAAIVRELDGGAAASLDRASRFLELIDAAGDLSPATVAELAGRALGAPVHVADRSDAPADGNAVPVVVDGRQQAIMSTSAGAGDAGARLVVRLAAELAGRGLERERRRSETPIRSTGLLLAELLVSPAQRAAALADRARRIEIPVDGWHIAVRLSPINPTDVAGADELAILELHDEIANVTLRAARRRGGLWYLARPADELILLRMSLTRPGTDAVATAVATARGIVSAVRSRLPGLDLRCGVGSAHPGVAGMRTSAAEARSAMAAAAPNAVLAFDAVGIRRMLAEWYASETARESVRDLLAPLDARGPRRAATAIATLRAYLDHQGSLTATAGALHLHRNAVRYRIQRIFEMLDVDPADADQRLALHLACRARDLG